MIEPTESRTDRPAPEFEEAPEAGAEPARTADAPPPSAQASGEASGTVPPPTEGSGTVRRPTEGPGTEQPPGEQSGTELPPTEGSGTEQPPGEQSGTVPPPTEGSGTMQPPGEQSGTELPPTEDTGPEEASGVGPAEAQPAGEPPAERPAVDVGPDQRAESWSGNGHPQDSPSRLPPPWQRTLAAPAPDPRSEPPRPRHDPDGRVGPDERTGPIRQVSGGGPWHPTAPTQPPAPPDPARAGTQTDLGEARTVRVEHRPGNLGVDAEPHPPPPGGPVHVTPPGGFPMGWPRNRRPRQANLQLKRLDPWSVLKIALVLAVVLYLIWLVAVGVLYGALDGIGVWDRINGQYADLVAEQAGDRLISAGRVFGIAAVMGAINSLLFAVALSVGAFIYNVAADLVGGIEVTLSERD